MITQKMKNGFGRFMRESGKLVSILREVFVSVPFMCFETVAAIAIVLVGQEVAGAVTFVALLCLKLVTCDDVLATTLPFLLLCTFVTNCYDSFDIFIGYVVWAPVVVACAIYHFVLYAKPARTGKSVYGIALVTVAVMLGGIGRFGIIDYVFGAYYVFGLGAGMLVAYYIMKAEFSVRRNYDFKERFAIIMTLAGVLAAIMVALGYFKRWVGLPTGGYDIGFSRNNISTFLMFAMPFPAYLGIKRKWISAISVAYAATLCVSTSRGGILFGGAEFIVCCAYWVWTNGKTRKERFRLTLICLAVLTAIVICFFDNIREVLWDRLLGNESFEEEPRTQMVFQAFEKFRESPLFGTGILDNTTTYGEVKKKGAMGWYHMMVPQVVGSMGLVGIGAYGFQIVTRVRAVFEKKGKWSLCLGISYLGILLMSQVNPGEFCPLPFELLTVLLFILQERRLEERSLPIAMPTGALY